jgi:hypothetical protein
MSPEHTDRLRHPFGVEFWGGRHPAVSSLRSSTAGYRFWKSLRDEDRFMSKRGRYRFSPHPITPGGRGIPRGVG